MPYNAAIARLTVICVLGLLLAGPRGVHAADRTRLECHIDAQARTIRGTVRIRVRNPTRSPLARAYVWLYPNRLAMRPAGVTDVSFYWVFPRRFNRGWMEITWARSGGARLPRHALRAEPHAVAGRRVLWSIALPSPVKPGAELELALAYRARIPQRYGLFGCHDDKCTLAGGFYPMLAAIDRGGWDLAAPPHRTEMQVRISLARPASLVIFDRWFGNDVIGAEASARDVPYATVHIAPRYHRSRRSIGKTTVDILTFDGPPPADDARGKILPYTKENYPRFALEAADEAYRLLQSVGARAGPTRVLIVESLLRSQLAIAQPRSIAISDRWYRIWPAQRFRKFHQQALVRALFAYHFAHRYPGLPARRDRGDHADLVAAYLTDVFTLRRYKKREFADDILAPVSFVPAVDLLLYAPQTMFADAYFGRILDDERVREQVARFMHQRPRGRLYYEKLRDLLGPRAMSEAMRAMILSGTPFRRAAEQAYGSSLSWFFRQWSRPYPRVNYRLVSTRSRHDADRGYLHRITVERQTAPGDEPPVEPVEVLVVLRGGARKLLRWDGRGQRATLELAAANRIHRVSIDPRGRLIEHEMPGASTHPRFDNRDRHDIRFVYNSFGVLLNVTDLSALLAADFSLSRKRDLRNRLDISLFTSAAVTAGLDLDYSRNFGPMVHQDKLLSSVSMGVGLRRLRAGFFGDQGASRLTVSAGLGSSNKLFIFEPLHAYSVGVGASVSLTRMDATGGAEGRWLVSGVASAGLSRTVTPWDGHTFAANLRLALAFGDIEARSQLVSSGGASGLRGFAPAELFSRGRALVRVEWRHNVVHDLNWNFGHYNFFHALGGAVFADGGLLTPCDSYKVGRESMYASVGYGFRTHYASFGTMPQMGRLDFAVRVLGRERSCLGAVASGFPPLMVYLTFLPPF